MKLVSSTRCRKVPEAPQQLSSHRRSPPNGHGATWSVCRCLRTIPDRGRQAAARAHQRAAPARRHPSFAHRADWRGGAAVPGHDRGCLVRVCGGQVDHRVPHRDRRGRHPASNHAAVVGDDYIRITVFLAAVLFLVGIGSIFKLYTVRYSLIGVGSLLLILAIVLILQQPGLRADRHLGRRLVGPTWLLLCGAGRLTSGWSPVGEACRWWIPPPGSLTRFPSRFLPLG
jgi:hypothetical protein